MKTTLLVSTYNAPRQLELSVRSLFRQTLLPDEIIIADDGSGEATFDVIGKLKADSPVPLVHVWQPDEGFRLGAARNKAIAAASGDYIIQIDGDIITERHFVQDHVRMAKKGTFVVGSRVHMNRELTQKVLASGNINLKTSKKWMRNTLNGHRIPLLTPLFIFYKNKVPRGRGCNMAFWKSDLMLVNGYNEDINGWGAEDNELACRFFNAGVKKRFIKFSAIEFHLCHNDNDRSSWDKNNRIAVETLAKKIKWIPNGIVKNNP